MYKIIIASILLVSGVGTVPILIFVIASMMINSTAKAIKNHTGEQMAHLSNKMEALHELSPKTLRAGYDQGYDDMLAVGADPMEYEDYVESREKIYQKYV